MNNECGLRGFIRRVLWKLSGQKIISATVSSLLVFLVVWARNRWAGLVTDAVALAAIDAIKLICLGLLGGNVALGITDIVKTGKPFNDNGNGEKGK